jgi:hypothetical protein
MPFFLVYGTEAVLPSEYARGSSCIVAYDDEVMGDMPPREGIDILRKWR